MSKLSTAAAGLVLAVALAVPATAQSPTKYEAYLSGKTEVPKTKSKATGEATLRISGKKVSYRLEAKGLSGQPQAAHIHQGKPGEAGEVIAPLATKPFKLPRTGRITVSSSVLKAIRSGDAYVNIHTKKYPAGEIRGQVKKESGDDS